MVWVMFNVLEVCLLFFRLPIFSQSPGTKQHVSSGLQIKIRNHLTLWDTERKFNCFKSLLHIFYSWPVQDIPFFTHWFYRLWMNSFFNTISLEMQSTFSKMRSGLEFFCFWKTYFWDNSEKVWFSKEDLGFVY